MTTTDYGTVQTSITRQDPAIEAFRLGLLRDVRDFTRQQIEGGYPAELDYRVAPLSRGEQMGISAAEQGLGAFLPYVQQGGQGIGQGMGLVGQAAQLAAAQRAVPYTYQQGAAQGIGQATQMGTLGTTRAQQLQEAQRAVPYTYQRGAAQGLGQATQLGTQLGLQGIGSLAGSAAMYDPRMAAGFFNPFEEAAVQRSLGDIAREGEIARQGIGARAVQSGAFGGSRQAVAEQELQRNVLEQQANTAAQLRAAGYQTAAQQAQQAFEQSRGRQIQGSQLTGQLGTQLGQLGQAGAQSLGQLGLQYGQLAQQDVNLMAQLARQQADIGLQGAQALGNLGLQYGQLAQQDVNQMGQLGAQMGQLGVQQAGMGEIGQNLMTSQLQNVLATGGLERGVSQSALDAARMSNAQRQAYPYQQYSFLSDIYSGVPSSQSVTTGISGSATSPFQQAVGLGISGLSAAAGAQQAGLFG